MNSRNLPIGSIWRSAVGQEGIEAFVEKRKPIFNQSNKEVEMIVRMWHGKVPTSKADAYREFTNKTAIPDYQSVKGNISVHILERHEGDITHFITLTFWESLEAIKGFAGENIEVAKYYPEDRDFLLEFEPTVTHYEVVGQS